ncbi:DUF1499 domain-containing protein [Oceanisphaera arctica]|uniref:DUF1499 domain-containing protein n=1 Tax=Oceanisphaera arctica TaxID=641510 RepID=A0A2P5TN45_9GAMM|nr:DUF1499 domain-containing protein [Oceanisphaera arctica]PPL16914.1 hypothetical protein UN63_07295 [Oceanisphaera arctica]GHA19264.1 hypothetical protein GCM10007082_19800 [Oceanisphaera arctica]
METLFTYRWILGSLSCVLLPLLGIVGVAGTRWHWWPYTLGLMLVVAAMGLALLLLPLALWHRQWLAALPPVILLLLLFPFILRGLTLPAIHDISTDTEQPPPLTAAARLRGPGDHSTDYAGEALARQQAATWSTLAPLTLPYPPEQVHRQVLALIAKRGWILIANSERQLEAVVSSRLFGFRDDVAIRLTPVENESDIHTGVHTRVDMRSASRVGKSDLGANAERIRAFLVDLERH